ncbi:hypothetical protein MUGA111182_02630 [Mucilaginibacter galii]|uniref:Protein NO VEIN C-terminal domain-containing protein n=1 Tax=Mucilaginibacter galii TaxID=2005073 RepID=A0A917N2P3_9SPHI|nr:hypothetical protein [Mucilaginibacter galii]GGI50287.1 hypothetical protein GCM10011425_14990 [Mucilaginibacter galii]
MIQSQKLTEDETIILLIDYLAKDGWNIDSHCLGQIRGCDIIASKNSQKFFIEVKGAKAGDASPTKKRIFFDSGQIKTHFGKAIVKILDDKYLHPNATFAIAHPNDTLIKKAIGHLTPSLKLLGIQHFWVAVDGTVTAD